MEEKEAEDCHASTSSKTPGLHYGAVVLPAKDENLPPFNMTAGEEIIYVQAGNGTSTDHPAWSPGVCPNLYKYQGMFRLKTSVSTQQVNLFSIDNCDTWAG
jgi:hypothetical protein